MKKHLYTTSFLLALIISAPAFSQSKQSAIKGYVFNSSQQPTQFSTVVLMNQDSVFMKGTLSGEDGLYLFDKLSQGNYFIMVRNVEFQTHVSNRVTVGQNEIVELDNILLETRVNDLEEVVIRGEKAMVEVRPDKMVYNVSSSVNASGNNALELLSKSPGIVVDMDRNIIVQGKSGVQIYINGRPSRISGNDLTNMLEGMRSENIESIEIITNPSAKFDAEGTAGIINIVMKKNLALGFNGNLIGSYSKGNQTRSSVGTSLNYSGEKISFFSSLNLSENNFFMERNEIMEREDFLLNMDSESLNTRQGLNFSGGLDYRINSEQTISIDARVLVNDRNNDMESITLINDIDEILNPEMLIASSLDEAMSENYNANINYSFIPNRSSSLSADLSFGTYSSSTATFQPNEYFNQGGSDLLRTVESEYDASTDINLLSAKVDYEKSISKFTFSTGAKYSYIQTDNQLAFYDIENDGPVLDIFRSNDFSYLEKIAAAYFIVSATPTDKLSFNAGLRVENTSSLGELVSAIPTPDDVVPRNYTTLFPNVSLSYSDQENHAISLSVGRRITRPNYQNLNPFERKTSELSAWKGNPFLEPNYISNYQLTYSFKRKLVISNTYSVTNNFFANVFEVVGDKGNVLIPRNMDKVTNNGLSVSYPQKVTKWWQFSTFLIYNYATYGGDIGGTVIDLKAHILNFRMQNNIRLPLGITMELSAFASTPSIWRGTVNVDAFYTINTGLKKEFFKERLLLQVSASDLFNTGSIYYYSSDYGGMVVDGDIFFDGRRISLSATYKFGNQKAKSSRRKKSALDDELNRISD